MIRMLMMQKGEHHFVYMFDQSLLLQLVDQLKLDALDPEIALDAIDAEYLIKIARKRGRDGRRLSSGDPANISSAALDQNTLAELTSKCLRSRTP